MLNTRSRNFEVAPLGFTYFAAGSVESTVAGGVELNP